LRLYFLNTAIPDPPFLNFSATLDGSFMRGDRREDNASRLAALHFRARSADIHAVPQSRFHQLHMKNDLSVRVPLYQDVQGLPRICPMPPASRKEFRLVDAASRHSNHDKFD